MSVSLARDRYIDYIKQKKYQLFHVRAIVSVAAVLCGAGAALDRVNNFTTKDG